MKKNPTAVNDVESERLDVEEVEGVVAVIGVVVGVVGLVADGAAVGRV